MQNTSFHGMTSETKRQSNGLASSMCCVPWRLADMEFVKSFTKPGGWLSLHDVFFGKQVHNTSFHSMTSETKQRSNGPM